MNMSTAVHAEMKIKRRPIRGAIYGLLLGLGVAVELVLFSVLRFSWAAIITVTVIGVVVGIIWSLIAPAKKAHGPNPNEHAFGSVFTSSADEGPPPTYEETFGSTRPQTSDDGAFGAGSPEAAPPDDGGGDAGGDAGGGDGGDSD